MRIEPPPSSQPLSARSYCSARARPAGSVGATDSRGRPTSSSSSGSSSGSTPLKGLCVASQRPFSASHWYIGNSVDPDVRERRRVGQARVGSASSTRKPPEGLLGVDVAVGDDEHEVARRGAGGLGDGLRPLLAEELDDRRADRARRPPTASVTRPLAPARLASSVSSSICAARGAAQARRREAEDRPPAASASSNTRNPEPVDAPRPGRAARGRSGRRACPSRSGRSPRGR